MALEKFGGTREIVFKLKGVVTVACRPNLNLPSVTKCPSPAGGIHRAPNQIPIMPDQKFINFDATA